MTRDVKHKIHQVGLQKNQLIVIRYVQNVRHWHERKHASVLAIGQLRHQSATTPSCATHAADAVACSSSNVMSSGLVNTLLKERPNGIVVYLQRALIPIFRYVNFLKPIQISPDL